ncbi:activity-regulated cytoskeleton-associated protein [Bombina bombina]|uniref:activity-regulated cytoskeleton-associated protein n=1 Tax=Bombina bombina TaxID=8345 RepID=UPI00235B3023|nr:activity-regulated cytoskeleton-associated protein [Bombina bombina]
MAAGMAVGGAVVPSLSVPEQKVALQIGTCSPAEMLDRVRKTQVYILSGVSRQVENELKGFKRSVQRLNSNMNDQSPVVGIQRWKRSIKACLLRCQGTLVNLERWVKREMNSWRGVFSRFEKMVSKADEDLCKSCKMEEKHKRSFLGLVTKSDKEKEAEASEELVDPYAPTPSPPCQPHQWVVISVDILSSPEFDADMSEDPREFLVNLEKYFKRSGWNEKIWLSQVDNHLKGAAKKWWEYRQETIDNWLDFKVAFLQYCERLIVREAIKRDLDLPQRRWEPLEQFVWKKRALYHRLYVDANEEEMIHYIISTLHPEIRRFLKTPLPKTMDQLVQRGKEIQFDFEQSEKQSRRASYSEEQVSTKLKVTVTKDPYDSSNNHSITEKI